MAIAMTVSAIYCLLFFIGLSSPSPSSLLLVVIIFINIVRLRTVFVFSTKRWLCSFKLKSFQFGLAFFLSISSHSHPIPITYSNIIYLLQMEMNGKHSQHWHLWQYKCRFTCMIMPPHQHSGKNGRDNGNLVPSNATMSIRLNGTETNMLGKGYFNDEYVLHAYE